MKRTTQTYILFALYDTVLVYLCLILAAWIHNGFTRIDRDESYVIGFLLFPLPWLLISFAAKKFRIGVKSSYKEVFLSVVFSNFIILSVSALIIFFFRLTHYSRFILFMGVILMTVFEILTLFIYVSFQRSVFLKDWIGMDIPVEQQQIVSPSPPQEMIEAARRTGLLLETMIEEAGQEASDWIRTRVDIGQPLCMVVSTDSRFNIINYPDLYYQALVNLHPVNDLRRINKFFETVNAKLLPGALFIGCGETYMLRKQRILKKFPPVINIVVYSFDYIFFRVFPKLILTRKFYFLVTGGRRRVISRTEILGRLVSCGFEIVEEQTIRNLLYWKTRKVRAPFFDTDPTYGLFIRLRRIGRNGKEFNVYKLRTMHAYAEYLQGFVYSINNLDEGGKFKNDFRVTTLGKILRKFWLDELPMLLNLIRGDMKIVGVRPLSRHYFNLYSEELQRKRTRFRPGLIPPYYAQYPTPQNLEEVQQNEMEYLAAYERHPLLTDLRYFFRAINNIVFRKARSK